MSSLCREPRERFAGFLKWIQVKNYELKIQGTHDGHVLFWLVSGMTIIVVKKQNFLQFYFCPAMIFLITSSFAENKNQRWLIKFIPLLYFTRLRLRGCKSLTQFLFKYQRLQDNETWPDRWGYHLLNQKTNIKDYKRKW